MTEARESSGRPLVSVIVPTLNEAGNIDRLLEALFGIDELEGRIEVVVADDRSTDGTVSRVEHWSRHYPVRLVQRDGPPDLAASVVAGAKAAGGRWVAVMDADGSHPAGMIPRLLEPLMAGRADVVVGSRHVPGGRIRNWPWWRRLVSRCAALMAWPFTSVQDPMSGLFATDRERLAGLGEERAGYKILLELLVRSRPEPRVVELPFEFTNRASGESKMGLATQWLFVKRLAALGGARLNLGTASRYGAVGLSGMLVDLFFFQLFNWLGAALAAAHMGSFLIATLSNFTLNYQWTFARILAPGEPVSRRYLRFLAVALMGLMMRGGVLAALVHGLGLDPSVAIVPAVIVTAGVNYLGAIFYVFPDRTQHPPLAVRWHLAAFALMAYVYGLWLLYMGQVDLIPDEMYYWTWGRLYPALSYLDHPPLAGWIIGATAWLAGDNAYGVRLAPLLLAPLAAWFMYLYGRDLIGRSAGLMAALLTFVVPGYFTAGFLMTPDAPLMAAWAAALYFFQRALVCHDRRAFLGLGLAMGFGLLSKYTMVLLAPAALVFMLADRRARAWFRRPEPYLAALLAAVMFLPVLVWNWQNDWASFAYQGARRLAGGPEFSSHLILVYLLLMLAPLAGFVALYVIGPVRRVLAPVEVNRRFMLSMALVPLGIFGLIGIFAEVKLHWTTPLWLALLPLIGATMLPTEHGAAGHWQARIQRLWQPAVVGTVIVFGVILHYIALSLPGLGWHEHRLGYLGWREIAEAVHEIEQQVESNTGRRPLVVGMTKWSTAAALAFHTPDGRRDNITARNLVGMTGGQWQRWFEPGTDPGRPLVLVNHEPKLIDEDWLEGAVIGLGPLQTRPVYRRGHRVQVLYYRIADGFRPEQVRPPEAIHD